MIVWINFSRVTLLNAVLASVAGVIPDDMGNAIANNILNNFKNNFNDAITGVSGCGNSCEDDIFMTESVMDLLYNGFEPGTLKALKWAIDNTNSIG